MTTGRTLGQMCGKGELRAVAPDNTVAEAAQVMRDHRVGAVLISEDGRLSGILSERDVTYRAVAAGLDPNTTAVSEVMTRNVITAPPETRAVNGLQQMAENQIRHLPVVDGGSVIGIVSLRDFLAEELAQVFQFLGAPPFSYCVADSERVFLKNLDTHVVITTYQYASGDGSNKQQGDEDYQGPYTHLRFAIHALLTPPRSI